MKIKHLGGGQLARRRTHMLEVCEASQEGKPITLRLCRRGNEDIFEDLVGLPVRRVDNRSREDGWYFGDIRVPIKSIISYVRDNFTLIIDKTYREAVA